LGKSPLPPFVKVGSLKRAYGTAQILRRRLRMTIREIPGNNRRNDGAGEILVIIVENEMVEPG
jgi:hypothetical protein